MEENRVVESMEPYEQWDLIAWPDEFATYENEFDEVLEKLRTPHLDGKPTRIGYVQDSDKNYVYVREAEHRRIGEPPIKNPYLKHHKPVRRDEILAKKQREHNQRYQREKKKRAQRKAENEWVFLPLLKRIRIRLGKGKLIWMAQREEEILENNET